jgi:hypothetical protein
MVCKRVLAGILTVGMTVATGLAVSGCGSSVSSVVDPVAQAAKASELAPGFKASLKLIASEAGSSEAVTASGTEVYDQRTQRGSLSMSIRAHGHSGVAEARYSKAALYMRLPSAIPSSETQGKPWIRFDLNRVGAAMGVNFSSLETSSSSNPSKLLSYLRGVGGEVARVGTEDVLGVPTTHYRATIDYAKYAASLPASQRPAARESVAALERLTGQTSQVVNVWVDTERHVRREELSYDECVPGPSRKLVYHITVEFANFGTQVIPPLPSSNEVDDVTNKLASKLKHIKLGCS